MCFSPPARAETIRRERYSLYRWLRDAELNFPKPIYIGRYRYWRLADLLAFEQSRSTSNSEAA